MKVVRFEKRHENGYIEEKWLLAQNYGKTEIILTNEEVKELIEEYNKVKGHKCCGNCKND